MLVSSVSVSHSVKDVSFTEEVFKRSSKNAVTGREPCLSGGNPALVLTTTEEFCIR